MRYESAVLVMVLAACGSPAPQITDGTADVGHAGPAPPAAGMAPPVPPDTRPVVLVVGTSLTAGYGLDDTGDSYPAVLQRMADSAGVRVRIVNAGLSGETSAGALRRVEWLLREPADVVIVETGANDGLRGLDVDSTRANLRAIVRRVRAALPTARIALVRMEAPPNLGGAYTRRFRESFEVVAGTEGAVLLPFLLEGVAGEAALNQGDGIHPNPRGARRVAENVWPALAPLIRVTPRP